MRFFLLIFFIYQPCFAVKNLDLNDVSVLFPLPLVNNWDQLIKADHQAKKGKLLPAEFFKKIPSLVITPSNEILYKDIRVMGMRFDPCFHEGSAPVQCKQQIRLTMQPLENVRGVTSTFDASLHLFYDLNAEEFKEFIGKISLLKAEFSSKDEILPLGVNPFLKKDGLQSDYFKKLTSLVFEYTGESVLSRITFMQVLGSGRVWDFGGFDIIDKEMKAINIPRVDSQTQRFINGGVDPRPVWFLGGIVPEPTAEENLNILIRDSRILAPQHEAEIIAAAKAAFRFENPNFHNPGTIDCVSCHVAQSAKNYTLRQFPWYNVDLVSFKDIYTNAERNLRNLSPMQTHTNILRSFGYFKNQPIVSNRTINESSEVLKYLNQNY
ncbi:MAG: hypothetical protein H7328_04065 [Bdellovibrio sp.]|nr:hypothetical protein [Bdellovibrio sp.]